VAARGDILALHRAIGFLPGERLEEFLVLQADRLSRALETVIVIPLDHAAPYYSGLPGILALGATETGEWKNKVALVPHLTSLPLERFSPESRGRLRTATLARVGRVVDLVLDLR
jgi:mRNA-degrading endonuclease toxin of MazEF toxin-antitoxin module